MTSLSAVDLFSRGSRVCANECQHVSVQGMARVGKDTYTHWNPHACAQRMCGTVQNFTQIHSHRPPFMPSPTPSRFLNLKGSLKPKSNWHRWAASVFIRWWPLLLTALIHPASPRSTELVDTPLPPYPLSINPLFMWTQMSKILHIVSGHRWLL